MCSWSNPEAIEAWKDLRFGMFICWGPVTLTGKEVGWSRGNPTPIEEYDALYKQWNPDKFDARQWIKVVKESGARYIVFLLKHHDGFCLWDTKQTDYNVMNGPFKRDVTKEIAAACREQGIGFFPYYSTCDWHHPDFPLTSPGGKVKRPASNLDRYTEYLEAQTKELITGYGPLLGIWFDVPQGFDRARGERVIRHVRSLQPDLVVNNRSGAPGDFDTPEQTVGRCQFNRPWESCITLGTQWSWKPDDTAQAVHRRPAHPGGLRRRRRQPRVEHQPDARRPDRAAAGRELPPDRRVVGEVWRVHLRHARRSVRRPRWSCTPCPRRQVRDAGRAVVGRQHAQGQAIYLHILRWPSDTITLPPIAPRIVKHRVLTGGEATVKQTDAGIEVTVPAAQRDATDTIVKLELDAPAKDIPILKPQPTGAPSLTTGKKATASNWFQKSDTYAPDKAVDGDPDTRWGCDWGTKSAWLEVDLGAPQTFSRAWISEPYDRVQEFELQVWQEEAWKTFHRGTTIGEDCQLSFPPVTGQRVRLNLLKTTDGPSIWEFQLEAGRGP